MSARCTVSRDLEVYVDVDDTLVRWAGPKAIPCIRVIEHVRALKEGGAVLTCWSTGGAEYARKVTSDLGIEDLFVRFLAKPQIMIDDQPPSEWRTMKIVHPFNASETDDPVGIYWADLDLPPR